MARQEPLFSKVGRKPTFPTGKHVVAHHNKECKCYDESNPTMCRVKLYEEVTGEKILKSCKLD